MLIRIDVDPALFGSTAPQSLHVLVAEGLHSTGDPFERQIVRNLSPRAIHDGCLDVVDVQPVIAERFAAHTPVAMPGRKVTFIGVYQVVKHLRRDVVRLQSRLQARGVLSSSRQKIRLASRRLIDSLPWYVSRPDGHPRNFPRRSAESLDRVTQEGRDVSLGRLDFVAMGAAGRRKYEICVGEYRVRVLRGAKWIDEPSQALLPLQKSARVRDVRSMVSK